LLPLEGRDNDRSSKYWRQIVYIILELLLKDELMLHQ
jgi:hypothetical protein